MTKIKICGLSRHEDVLYVNKLKPDYAGFVFAKKSRRYLSDTQAKSLRAQLDPKIVSIGVFVDDNIEHIKKLVESGVIEQIQLHGQEDEDYIESLRQNTKQPIIKAYTIDSAEDIVAAQKSRADFILLDHGKGGTGETFDWQLIQNFKRPFFLAGGLEPINVAQAIAHTKPYAVDVSSGVEENAYKSYDKIKMFINNVRTIDERINQNEK